MTLNDSLFDSDDDALNGSLLLASPELVEPTFSRTVILLTNHSAEDGALGYVLNRPMDKVVKDVLPDPDLGELHEVPLFLGGPVGQENLTFSSLAWDDAAGQLQFHPHLSASDALRHLKEGFEVRAFVGYSGWSAGQLEGELEIESWVVQSPSPEVMKQEQMNSQIWSLLIRDVSPLHRLAADMPDDLSMN